MRQLLRRLTLDALAIKSTLLGEFAVERIPKQTVQFILLHHIEPREEANFVRFLGWMKTRYKMVSYSDAVKRLRTGEVNEPIATISFDDGLSNNFRAAEIMRDHDVSGCFFVCPSIVNATDLEKIEAFCRERLLFDRTDTFLGWDQLESLREMGHEIGNHSQNHRYLMELEESAFLDEVMTAQVELVKRLGECHHFAWPYGRFFHFKEDWVLKVLQEGFKSCASGERGAHRPERKMNRPNEDDWDEEDETAVDGEVVDPNAEDVPPLCLLRDSLSMAWPLRHSQYFVNTSSLSPKRLNEIWPQKAGE